MISTYEMSHLVFRVLRRPIVALVFTAVALTMAPPSWAKTLTIGTISASPVDEIRTFQPFADYLAGELAGDGIDAVKVAIAANINEMSTMLKYGETDLYIDSSVTALLINKLSGSKFMLRRWKKGRARYRSVIFVLGDSDIFSLAELRGKIIAFEEPFSTSGFMLPALAANSEGLELISVSSIHAMPPADRAGYVMAFDNETQTTWVERGRVQAAAMAEDDFNDFAKTALKPLRALHVSPFVPYHVVTHRPGLEAPLVERIKTVLKSAHETEHGRQVLTDFERTTKFDDIPPELLADVLKLEPFLHLISSLK